MSRYIATRALRGANLIVQEFDNSLQRALAELGPTKRSNSQHRLLFCPPSWVTPAWRSATSAG